MSSVCLTSGRFLEEASAELAAAGGSERLPLPVYDSRAYIDLLPFCPFWLHQGQASLLLEYRTTSMQALSHLNEHDMVSTGVMLHS
jgi:hypothetical protein